MKIDNIKNSTVDYDLRQIAYWTSKGIEIEGKTYPVEKFSVKGPGLFATIVLDDGQLSDHLIADSSVFGDQVKANKTDLDNLKTDVTSQGIAISTKAKQSDLLITNQNVTTAQTTANQAKTDAQTAMTKATEAQAKSLPLTGNAVSSSKLATPRKLGVSLQASALQNFDGTDDVANVGVSGVLPITNGGTGTNDGVINTIAYANSADGNDGFTTVYPNLNLIEDGKFAKPISPKWNVDGTTISKDDITGYFRVNFAGTGSYNRAYYTASVSTIPIGQKYSVYIKAYSLEDSLNIKLGTVNTSQAVTVTKNSNVPKIYKVEGLVRGTSDTLCIFGGLTTTLGALFISEIKVEPGSTTTLYMPSASEVTTADYPKYVGFSNIIKPNKTSSDYKWLPLGLVSIDSITDLQNQIIVNKASISTKANQTDLDNLKTDVTSQGIAISTKAKQSDLLITNQNVTTAQTTADQAETDAQTAMTKATEAQANSKELKDSINAVSEQANAASSSQFSFDKSPMSKGFSNVLVSKFEIGMVNTTDGSTNLDNKRGHSNLFDVTQLDWSNTLVNFYPKFSNFKIGIAQYRSDASFISNTGYFDSNKSLKDYILNPDTTKIRWIVAARDDHTLTQGELDRFSAYVGLLYGKVQLSRSLTALEGEYVDTVYTLDSGGSNTLKKKPLLIFDDISHCRLNTSEILRFGYVANNISKSELVADVILDTSMLGSNSNKAIFYNHDIKTMYVIDGISVSDSNKAISKNCVSFGFVCYPLPQVSSTKIQVSVEGKLVLPYEDEYATRLKALEDGVGSKLSGKYISIMGDSISKFKDYGETGTRWGGDSYPSSDVTDVSQMWWKLASDKLGATILTVNANAGSTCTTANPDRIEASSDYRTSRLGVSAKKPDVIICEIGTNDFIYGAKMGSFDGSASLPSTTSTFREAYSNMLKKIQANYPDAKIYGCTVHQNLHSGYLTIKNKLQTVVNNDGLKLKELNNIIREVCGLFGAGVIDFESCGLTLANIDKNTTDTAENVHLHPKKAGHAMFADKVVQALR